VENDVVGLETGDLALVFGVDIRKDRVFALIKVLV
jgi:hypothetical protein